MAYTNDEGTPGCILDGGDETLTSGFGWFIGQGCEGVKKEKEKGSDTFG